MNFRPVIAAKGDSARPEKNRYSARGGKKGEGPEGPLFPAKRRDGYFLVAVSHHFPPGPKYFCRVVARLWSKEVL